LDHYFFDSVARFDFLACFGVFFVNVSSFFLNNFDFLEVFLLVEVGELPVQPKLDDTVDLQQGQVEEFGQFLAQLCLPCGRQATQQDFDLIQFAARIELLSNGVEVFAEVAAVLSEPFLFHETAWLEDHVH